jgi:hypothetical protein
MFWAGAGLRPVLGLSLAYFESQIPGGRRFLKFPAAGFKPEEKLAGWLPLSLVCRSFALTAPGLAGDD